MIKIRVQLEELVSDMYSHVREVDITLDDVALKQIANALGWRNARGVLEQRPTKYALDEGDSSAPQALSTSEVLSTEEGGI